MRSQNDPNKKRSQDWRVGFREASPYLGLGMQLAISMAFFTIGGYLLDLKLDTTPWLTVAGGVIGMVAVFVQLVRVSRQMSRRSDRRNQSGTNLRGPSGP